MLETFSDEPLNIALRLCQNNARRRKTARTLPFVFCWLSALPALSSGQEAKAESFRSRLSINGDAGLSIMASGLQRNRLDYDLGVGGVLHPQIALAPALLARVAFGRWYFPSDLGYGAGSFFGAGLRAQRPRTGTWVPFVDIDVGLSRTGDRSRWGVVGGLGAEAYIGKGFSLGPIIRYAHIVTRKGDEDTDAKFFTVGVSVTLGSVPSGQSVAILHGEDSDAELTGSPGNGALAAVRGGGIETLHSIHFDFGKATLTAQSIPTIRAIAGLLFSHPNIERMTIEGHADAVGPESYNRTLSRERALTIKKLLSDFGVEPARLEVKERGEAQPVAPNYTESGRAANRRVEFVIEPRSSGETSK